MIRLALIDGPLPDGHPAVLAREPFRDGPVTGPASAHAAALAAAATALCLEIRILNLVVFGPGLATDAATVTRALARAAELAPDLALCAFGMARRDAALAAAAACLLAAGCPIVAAAPARGGPAWPAALPGVIAVQGDARCRPGEWSHLALPHAAFGACPGRPGLGGASLGAAHFAGHLAARLAAGHGAAESVAMLRAAATFHGRERRGAAAAHP